MLFIMNMKAIVVFLGLMASQVFAQDYSTTKNDLIVLDNGVVVRKVVYRNDSLYSSSLALKSDNESYIYQSKDFSFFIDDKQYSGYSGWTVLDTHIIQDSTGGNGVKIVLLEKADIPKIQVEINYLLYPDLPLIRKWIKIINIGRAEIKLESLNNEDLITKFRQVHSVVYHNYARMKHLGRFIGNWHDPVVVVHQIRQRKGIALGNEAIGVLKRTAYHTVNDNVEIGLTQPGQNFPFRKWIKPGESWQGPKSFICLYTNEDDGFQVVDNEINEFVVKHMKPRILQIKEKPTFVYNTWNPFRTAITDTLIWDVARAAAECGIQEFIIDDGWQVNFHGESSTNRGVNFGDWLVDENKFQGGLKPTFDSIKALGMKPGLWISLASATGDSRVFMEHPEWFVERPDGKPGNLHYESNQDGYYSASFGTDWYDYIKETIIRLVDEYGLTYAKLDLAVVTSPYVNNDSISGSYATDHPYHKDHEESFIVLYERLMNLFDELHLEAPGLFIDCTFETAGKLQLMDYAIAQHAEGNWLSNFEEPSPLGPLRIRQMAWWRSPALPASSLVIGNLPMNDPEFEFGLKSLIGTLPIVLGDPRKIPDHKRRLIHDWSSWMQKMQKKYDYMSYRKDLPGFGEPKEGLWDGWQRINFQSKEGGIFGLFRQGALEDTRKVFLKDLYPGENYVIRLAPYGDIVHKASGRELMQTGFNVQICDKYDANIYEVSIQADAEHLKYETDY